MNIQEVSIVDQLGRAVDFMETREGSLLGVELSDPKAGIYIVSMATENGVVQERFVLTSAGE